MVEQILIDDKIPIRTDKETKEHQKKVREWYKKVSGDHVESDKKIRVKDDITDRACDVCCTPMEFDKEILVFECPLCGFKVPLEACTHVTCNEINYHVKDLMYNSYDENFKLIKPNK